MDLKQVEYNCCLDPANAQGCESLPEQPHKTETPACKNIWTRHCSKSSNLVTPACRAFIDDLNGAIPPLADMDEPVRSFCAMHRTESDPHYDICRCVNATNTCLGQKISRFKSGSVGCYYPACKEQGVLKTSDLFAPECRSVVCTIGDINIDASGGAVIDTKGMVNQNCGGAVLQAPAAAEPSLQVHSSSACSQAPLASPTYVPAATAARDCMASCAARGAECAAYQTICPANVPSCTCTLFDKPGFAAPSAASCVGLKKSQLDHTATCGDVIDASAFTCYSNISQ